MKDLPLRAATLLAVRKGGRVLLQPTILISTHNVVVGLAGSNTYIFHAGVRQEGTKPVSPFFHFQMKAKKL